MKHSPHRQKMHCLRTTTVAVLALTFLLAASMCLAGVRWTTNGVELRGTGVTNKALDPQITSDGSGGAIVTWIDNRSGSQWGIYAQKVDSSGTPQWAANGVELRGTGVAGNASSAQITSDGSGGAIVTWRDDRSGKRDIYARRIDSSGTPQWTTDGVELRGTGLTNWGLNPQITSDGSGGAVVTWYDNRGGSQYDIYAQRVDSSGTPQWTTNGVELRGTGVTNNAWDPEITSDGSGGAIVTWFDNRSGSQWGIYARKVDSSGTPRWTANGVELRGTGVTNNAKYPQIASDGSGGAIVTWNDYRSGSRSDIYARSIDSSGTPQWTANGVELRGTGVTGDAYDPEITSDGSGGAIVTWYDYRSGSKYDIYAQRVDSSGVPRWTANGVELRGTGVTNDAWYPRITSDGSGGAVVTWYDDRSGKEDIYAQRVSGDTIFYFAEGYTGSGFQEYLCLGNPWSAPSSATITYMFPDGTTQDQMVTVPANSRTTIDVNAVVGADKQVSAKVVADMPIVVERPMYFSYNGVWAGGHDSVGATSPSGTWYFAEGYTGAGFDEYICVLNPGDSLADLTFSFQTQEEGEKVVAGFSVAPHSRASFKVNDLLQGGSYQTSLKLESNQPVVAERPMYFDYSGTASWHWQGGHCVMGTPSLSNAYYFAEGTTRSGFEEWITLQNPGNAAITIDATYQLGPGQGDPITKSYDVAASSRRTLYVPDEVGMDKDVSVHLSSGSDFLAERPMYFSYSYPGLSAQGGHCVIGAASQSQEWFFAEGYTGAGFNEWICLQNSGTTDANIEITYLTQEAGALPTQDITLAAGTRLTLMVNDLAGADYQLSCRINSDVPIVVERPMYFNYNGAWPGGHDVVGYVP